MSNLQSPGANRGHMPIELPLGVNKTCIYAYGKGLKRANHGIIWSGYQAGAFFQEPKKNDQV